MKNYVVFEELSGKILRSGVAPEELVPLQAGAGERWAITPDWARDDTHYVSDVKLGLVSPRPSLTLAPSKTTVAADGVDAAVIDVPANAEVVVEMPWNEELRTTVAAPPLELTFDRPGTYRVKVSAFPYRDAWVEIHAA